MNEEITIECIVETESTSFPVDIPSRKSVGHLKDAIHLKKNSRFNCIDANILCLWKAKIPNRDRRCAISLKAISDKEQLNEGAKLFELGLTNNDTYVIVEDPKGQGKRRAPDDGDGDTHKRVKTLETELSGRELIFPSFRYQHHFYDRENFTQEAIAVVASNYNCRMDSDHKSHTSILIPGGSGIGKTRAGYELQNLIAHADQLGLKINVKSENLSTFRTALQNSCYLYVNLKSGCSYTYAIDENQPRDIRISARLAIAAGLGPKSLEMMTKDCALELYTVDSVLQEIIKRRPSTSERTIEAIIIHIDEYQEYIKSAQSPGGRTYGDALKYFKEMLDSIGQLMVTRIPTKPYFIIPVCTGTFTIDGYFLHSDCEKKRIQLGPLDYESAVRMFRDKYGSTSLSRAVEDQHHFRIALNDTGFIPTFIDNFLDPENLSREYDWGNTLFSWICSKYFQNSGNYLGSKDDVRAIISLGITKLVITRGYALPSGETVGEVERVGLVYLADANNGIPNNVTVVMPLMLLKMLNLQLDTPVVPDDLLLIPTVVRPWRWGDFEQLLPYYQKALIDAMINTRPDVILKLAEIIELERTSEGSIRQQLLTDSTLKLRRALNEMKTKVVCPLSDVFRGAKGSRELLDRQVILQVQEVFKEETQCLRNKSDVLPFTNDILCDDGIRRGREDGLFLSKKNNANLDCRWIMKSGDSGKPLAIFIQAKHSELTTKDDKFNHETLKGWYDRILHSCSSFNEMYDVVIAVVTNMKYNNPGTMTGKYRDNQYGPDGISDMSKLLLIDKSNIMKYLSPTFAYRGILAIPDDHQAEKIQPIPLE